jgi:hypothetical protein
MFCEHVQNHRASGQALFGTSILPPVLCANPEKEIGGPAHLKADHNEGEVPEWRTQRRLDIHGL